MYQFRQSNDEEVLKTIKKRRNFYIMLWAISLVVMGLVGVIPTVGIYITWVFFVILGIFAGLAMYCINNYRYIVTGGAKQGGGLLWLVLFVFGFFIVPIIVVQICAHSIRLSEKVLGVELLK